MQIEHIAIWTNNLERLRLFYETFFKAQANDKYENSSKQFASYFLSFESGTRLEIMERADVQQHDQMVAGQPFVGLAHFAISIGSKTAVDRLTQRLIDAGYACLDGPRWTGDGYYESVILDPDGNQLEITI